MAIVTASRILGATANELAVALARKHDLLVEETGEIHCWFCGRLGALLPTLRCKDCHGRREEKPTRETTVDRWVVWADALRDDHRLDRARALRILDHASKRWDATPARLEQLRALVDKRFPVTSRANDPRYAEE